MCKCKHLIVIGILVFVTGILHTLGKNNSNRRMFALLLGLGLVTRILYGKDIERYWKRECYMFFAIII